jgi:rod shape-determining protein MreC
MTAPAGSRLARRRAAAFGILLAISVVLMIFSSTGPVLELRKSVAFAFRPFQVTLDSVARGVSSVVSTIGEIDQLHQANEQLARDNARLLADNARTAEIERQNVLLTGLLNVRGSLSFKTVAGTVIGRESAAFRRVVTIDVGTERGVKEGDVVVGEGGALVGQVTGVAAGSATVLLISDTSSTVTGQLGPSRALGSVVGQLVVLAMENLDPTAPIHIGDQVFSAGIDLGGGVRSPFPKGLLIGTVVDVQRNANAVTQTAFIQPSVDLDGLEYLLVITDYVGGLPPIDQQPIPCGTGGTLPAGEQPCVTPTPVPARSALPSASP